MALTVRSVLRGALFGSLGLAGLLLAVGLAWVASNWADDAPLPTPAPASAPEPALALALALALAASAPARLAVIKGLPLSCRAPDDCPTVLINSAAKVVAQLQPHALLGERCVAALGNPAYVEALPAVIDATMTLSSYVGAVQCELWFKGQALVAAAQGDRAATLLRLQQGSQLVRSMLTAGRLLISQMIASAMARSHYDAITAVAMLQPGWAAALAPLTAPLPPEALDATRWLATESAFTRGTLDMTFTACAKGSDMLTASEESIFNMGSALACKTGVRLLPNATRQALALGLAAATQKVPPADRVAWLQQQAVPPALKPRLAWVDNNAVLTVRPWMADVAGNDPRKAPIRVLLAAF